VIVCESDFALYIPPPRGILKVFFVFLDSLCLDRDCTIARCDLC